MGTQESNMFFGGGGFPGGFDPDDMGGGGGRSRKKADTTGLYKLLGVEKSSSEAEIKKAYKKLAMKHHPDKGGDPEKFKEMTAAQAVLTDPDKRKRYDQGGMEAVEGGGGGGGDDLMDMMFGGGRGGRNRGPKKGQDVVRPLQVSLEDLYMGVTKKLRITRQTIDKEKGVKKCSTCGGQGVVVRTIRMGPMIQQMQQPCSACEGQGYTYDMTRTTEVLEVNVQKGAPDGHKIVFHNKADEIPDGDAGDVVFVLKEKPHDLFYRHGADLYIKKKINLVEALCGFCMEIPKLDGRTLVVKTNPGEVTNITTFDPKKADAEDEVGWEVMEGFDCDLDDMAQADSADVDMLKKAVAKGQLKGKGIGCFVVQGGRTTFKKGTREECIKAKSSASGATMYVLADASTGAKSRMMKAVEGEGLPLMRDPYQFGNLFLQLEIEFPTELSEDAVSTLKSVLPAPLNSSSADEEAENVDTHFVSTMDPVASHKDGIFQTKDAMDSDDDEGGMGGQRVQCAQQ